MPCLGPTEQELRGMEIAENKRKYGVAGTDLDIATKVACHLSKGEHNSLTMLWSAEHDKQDRERLARQAENEAQARANEEIAAATKLILKKHGLRG